MSGRGLGGRRAQRGDHRGSGGLGGGGGGSRGRGRGFQRAGEGPRTARAGSSPRVRRFVGRAAERVEGPIIPFMRPPPRFRPRLIRPGPPVSPGRNRGGELERRAYRGRDPGCRRLPERHQPFSRGQGRAARSPRCPDRRRRSASLTPRRKQTPWTPSRGPVRPRRAPGPCAPRPRPFGQLRRRRATFVAQRSIDGPCTTTPGSAPDTSSP